MSTTLQSKIKDAVDAGKSNPEGNIMMKDLEIDQKCRDDFNTWYWNRVKLKEGKKFVSKSIGTCEGSINEPFTRSLPEKCYNNNCKFVGNSFESVSLGERTFKRDVGIQASVSVVKGKHDDADDSDEENVKEKADAHKGSVIEKSKKFKKIKDDTSDAEESSKSKMRKKLKKLKKIMDNTSDEEDVEKSKKSTKRNKAKEDASDEEEFNECKSLKYKKKKEVNDVGNKRNKDVEDNDLDCKTDIQAQGKSRKMNVKTSGGSFDELSTEDEKDDDHKFSQRVVNDVKKNADPEEDSVKMENRSHYKDALGNILLVMQACFVVLSTRSCGGCAEVLKALGRVDSHLDGWHVMDVYKPHKARMTVKTSSYGSNHLCYQLKSWMTCGTELRWLMCQGKRYCKEMTNSKSSN